MSIWKTQEVHNAVIGVLRLHRAARTAGHALVDVSILNVGTTGALMRRTETADQWEIERLYTADHYLPGDVGVVIVWVW